MAGTAGLDRLSLEELEKLCVVSFWLGIGGDRAMQWGDSRKEMELFLEGVSAAVIEQFQRFLEVEGQILVPEDHAHRVAKLPHVTRAKAALVAPAAFERRSEAEAFEEIISPEDSELVLRSTNWAGRTAAPAEDGSRPS